ncbi:MAG: RNA polymerase sigma factor [Planctomycetes bacterium]|nr:RNA polymerase sigma factor [Planctomycetota bacterium]
MFDAHRDAVHRLLFRLARNRADADDLLQETFLTVWRKRGQFEGRGSAEGWLKRTAFRTYLNSREKRQRRDRLDGGVPRSAVEPTAPPADGEVSRRESVAFLAARLDEALAVLPDEMREAFVLFRYEGLTCAQIGEMTGVPPKTVETRVRRATVALAERLAPWRDHLGTH